MFNGFVLHSDVVFFSKLLLKSIFPMYLFDKTKTNYEYMNYC